MLWEKLRFKGHSRFNLVGILRYPEEYGMYPSAILCHGLRDTKDLPILIDLEKALNKLNIATFRMDFSGSGESEGNFEDKKISEMAVDLECGINTIIEHQKIMRDKIALMGRSFSSLIVMLVGAKVKSVKAMVLMSTPFNPLDENIPINRLPIKKGLIDLSSFHPKSLKKGFLDDLRSLNFNDVAKDLSNVLIIHGDSDSIVNVHHSINLYEKIKKPKGLRIIPGANHKFEGREDEITKIVEDWFKASGW